MDKFIEIIAGYGPFPAGIIVGVWLARGAYNRALTYMEKITIELREEKKQLRETIEAQQKRIDLLHDEAYNKKKLLGNGGSK
jgi:hypothetical protein